MQRDVYGNVCYRKEDVKAEKISCQYLYENFYGKFKNIDCEFILDKERQEKGIDVILKFQDGRERYVDNKSTNLHWMNSGLTNAAIELSFMAHEKDEQGCWILDENGSPIMKRVDGWFLNSNNVTDDYLFYWTKLFEGNGFPVYKEKRRTNYFSRFRKDDIECEEIMFVTKYCLKKWCDSIGLTEDVLRYYVAKLANKSKTNQYSSWEYITDEWGYPIEGVVGITISDWLIERPVLLILNHKKTEELAFMHCNVFPDKIMDLNCPRRDKFKCISKIYD